MKTGQTDRWFEVRGLGKLGEYENYSEAQAKAVAISTSDKAQPVNVDRITQTRKLVFTAKAGKEA